MRYVGRLAVALLLAGGLGFVVAADALAQACLGVPAGAGQYAVSAGVDFTDGATGYGLGGHANLTGPFSVGAGYTRVSYDNGDEGTNTFSGKAAYELPGSGISACPTVGLSYNRVPTTFGPNDGSVTTITVPVGFSVGNRLPAGPALSFTPFAMPHLLYVRTAVDDGTDTTVESTKQFGTVLGIVLGGQKFYGSAGVLLTTIDDSDPSFSIGLGAVVR